MLIENKVCIQVVLASQPDLESGFARDLFIQWVENDKNSIILTTRTCPGTLARQLIDNPSLASVEVEVNELLIIPMSFFPIQGSSESTT